MTLHRDTFGAEIHVPYRFYFINDTHRLAQVVTESDIGCLAFQFDTNEFWILKYAEPVVWVPLGILRPLIISRTTTEATTEINITGIDTVDITLQVASTINIVGGVDGKRYLFRVTQAATPVAVTWGTMCKNSAELEWPVITAVAGKVDYIGFIYHEGRLAYDIMAYNQGF